MVALYREGMFDENSLKIQLGGLVTKKSHLEVLRPVEEYIVHAAPLPISYDVSRVQPWYYTEFSYTEFCGGMIILPQSSELAVRNIHAALNTNQKKKVDVTQFIFDRIAKNSTGDKYNLTGTDKKYKKVAFLPGSNIFLEMVSRELLSRAMFENEDMVIKPHPLTHDQMLRMLCSEYGAHRILDPKTSAWDVIQHAEDVYTVATSEMSAYAVLLGKRTHDITNFLNARGASYFPILWDVIGKDPVVAKERLLAKLNSSCSGIVFHEDPNWKSQVDAYFKLAMEVREQFKPMVWNSFKPVICKNSVVKEESADQNNKKE